MNLYAIYIIQSELYLLTLYYFVPRLLVPSRLGRYIFCKSKEFISAILLTFCKTFQTLIININTFPAN